MPLHTFLRGTKPKTFCLGMAFDYTDGLFSTPLIQAIISKKSEDVDEALNRGFSANLQDNRGWTPLHLAAQNDERIACLKSLLHHKSANINSQTFEGETPLFIACQNDSLQIAEVLLNNPKCNVNIANNEGISPLHVACNKRNKRTLELLFEFGPNINSTDFNGYTPLHEVLSQSSLNQDQHDKIALQICKYLVGHGANPDIAENEGNLPFHFSCQSGLLKSAKFLLSVTKQPDLIILCNCDGRSPLMLAVTSKSLRMIEFLLSQGANPNVADNSDIISLHLAAHTSSYDIFNIILKVTSNEYILKYCTLNEHRLCQIKRINSLICLAIDTEDLQFLFKILDSGLDKDVLQCPIIHSENPNKRCFTLHTPISFLLESKMSDLGESTLDFLNLLITKNSPLKMRGSSLIFNYVDPICAALVALNDCPSEIVTKSLKVLLEHGADPDEPHDRMPYSMEQACMRGCTEAVLLLLQYTNILIAEDILTWIECETCLGQMKTVATLLTLAPYYTPSERLLPDVKDGPERESLLAPQVFSLASYCRTIVRRQLRLESSSCPTLFRQKLLQLDLPKDILNFIRYM